MYKKNSLKKAAAIKIATYNVLFSMNTKSIVKNIAALADEAVVIFCLQEIVKTNDKKFIVDEILGSLGKNWQASYHLGNQNSIDSGTCIIWNRQFLKLEKIEKILLPKIKKLAIHEFIFDKLIGQKGLPAQRRAISALFKFQGKNVLITNVHLDNVGGKRNRLKQLQYLLELLRRDNQFSYQIICGDFNSFDLLKTGVEKKRLEKVLGSNFSDAAESISWTADIYNMALAKKSSLFTEFIKILHLHIRRKLDYIWIKNFKLIECRKIIVPGSDHYPIVAKLMFSPTLD